MVEATWRPGIYTFYQHAFSTKSAANIEYLYTCTPEHADPALIAVPCVAAVEDEADSESRVTCVDPVGEPGFDAVPLFFV